MSTARAHGESLVEHAGPWIPEWTLADRLRKARQSVQVGQREFAAQLGVSAPTYSQWEAGGSRPRDLVAIAKRVELLTRIPAAWILGVADVGTTPTGPAAAGGWAPWGSNPQPADNTSGQVIAGPWAPLADEAEVA